jgi:hypothetical protein
MNIIIDFIIRENITSIYILSGEISSLLQIISYCPAGWVSRQTTYGYIYGYIYWNFKTGSCYEGVIPFGIVEGEDGIVW